jgi:Tfp pilus tip-associated adhesin PilY1
MASLTDPAGNPQPVTTPPQIEIDIANGVDRWVFIGTGRLLDETDITDATINNQQQTFYAIRDGTTTQPLPITAPLQPRQDFSALTDKVYGLPVEPDKGWYDDLPTNPGERIITAVQAALSIVAYAGTAPQDNPCLSGEPATVYAREFARGNSLLTDPNFPNSTVPVSGVPSPEGAVGVDLAIFSDSSGPQSASGLDVRVVITAGTTGGAIFRHLLPTQASGGHRMSWRLLGQ